MSEQTTPQSGDTATATPPAAESAPVGEQQTAPPQDVAPSRDDRTPAEVEAHWKNRQSSEAAAFAAKEQQLRDQISELTSKVKEGEVKGAAKDAADQTEVERLRAMNQTLNEQLEQTQKTAIAETRKAKYPHAAENIEASVLSQMDEANLAALNEKLKPNASGGTSPQAIMDANQAARATPPGNKPQSEKTAEELQADLAATGEAWKESFRGR